jgi:hypothetical protein
MWRSPQDEAHTGGRHLADPHIRFDRDPGDVWGGNQVGCVPVSGTGGLGQRLFGEDVERCTAEVAAAERLDDGVLIDDSAPRRVDKDRSGAHRRDVVLADHVAGLVGERDVDAHGVTLGEGVIERL